MWWRFEGILVENSKDSGGEFRGFWWRIQRILMETSEILVETSEDSEHSRSDLYKTNVFSNFFQFC
jgi:hypothetical protein